MEAGVTSGSDVEYLLRLLHWSGTLRHPGAGRWSSRAFYVRNMVVATSVLLFVCSQAAVIVLEGAADLERFTRALCFFNTAGTWLLRLAHVAVREKHFHAIALQVGSDFDEFVSQRDAVVLRSRARLLRRFVHTYLCFGIMAGVGWDVFPLVRYGICGDGLPFHMALPYSVDRPLAFAATWFYCFCMTMHVAVVTMVFDAFNVSLMAQLRQQLSLLSGNICGLADETRRESPSVMDSSHTIDSNHTVDSSHTVDSLEHIRYRLRTIVRHHQAIIRLELKDKLLNKKTPEEHMLKDTKQKKPMKTMKAKKRKCSSKLNPDTEDSDINTNKDQLYHDDELDDFWGNEYEELPSSLASWCTLLLSFVSRNVDSLEKCLGGMLLGQSLSIGASVCFQLFQVATSADSLAEASKFGCYLSVMLAQLFVYCWFGDELITESEQVSAAVYSVVPSLQGCPTSVKRSLLLVMTRAQRPLRITAAGFFDISRESFVQVLNVSYSFFAILRNFKEE